MIYMVHLFCIVNNILLKFVLWFCESDTQIVKLFFRNFKLNGIQTFLLTVLYCIRSKEITKILTDGIRFYNGTK